MGNWPISTRIDAHPPIVMAIMEGLLMSAPDYSRVTGWLVGICFAVVLQACKHPLGIVGEGDIVEVGNTGRGCSLEQFRVGDPACTENEITGDYLVS